MRSTATTEPLSVLVVDDDSALIRTLADILRFHGYEPATAMTAREGLALAAEHPPALAIVDLRLPDMEGTELASRLHGLSEFTQVVVLTGNASVESAVAALRQHSVDYLLKPVNVERLLQVASLATERWQRHQAEERLRESDERFRRVVESDLLGIFFWDEGGIYDANDAFLSMVGQTRADLETGLLTESMLTPPEYGAVDVARERAIEARGVSAPYEKAFYTSDDGRVPVLVGAASLEGRVNGGVAFVLDISERKRAEHALEARAAQQAAVAAFGQRALASSDLGSLFHDAAVLVSETLDAPFSSVIEKRSNGGSLVLRAGVGWDRDAIGQVRAVSGGPASTHATPSQPCGNSCRHRRSTNRRKPIPPSGRCDWYCSLHSGFDLDAWRACSSPCRKSRIHEIRQALPSSDRARPWHHHRSQAQ
jgi:PAS domain S-box-containing protein